MKPCSIFAFVCCTFVGASLSAQTLSYDDGLGSNINTGATSSLWLVRYATPTPGVTQVSGLSAAFGPDSNPNYPNGQGLTFGLWSDPNGDGNPSDAVLLASGLGVTANVTTGAFVNFSFAAPVTVTTSNFFVGYYMPAAPNSYIYFDNNNSLPNTTWLLIAPGDTVNLANNSPGSTFDLNGFSPGVGLVHAELGVAAVPEPATVLAGLGAALMGGWTLLRRGRPSAPDRRA